MLEYFKKLLCDELDGAKEYVKLALEFKSTYPEWAKMFLDMSAMELSHAANIYRMSSESYNSTVKAYNEPPKWIEDMWEHMVDMYAEKTSKVKYMHEMYSK